MKTANVVFITIFVFVCVSTECRACVTYDLTYKEGLLLKSGNSFYRDCYCKTSPNESISSLRWLDGNDQEIASYNGSGTKPLIYTQWADESLDLYIPSLGKSLSGTYKCVSDVGGRHYPITNIEVVAYDPLIFFNTPEMQSIVKGADSMIYCEVKADAIPRIDWTDGHEYEITNSDKYEIKPRGLVIKNVRDHDEGTYKCTVNIAETGENVDRFITVKVVIAPHDIRLSANPENVVTAGSYLALECTANGFPLPQYRFKKTSDMVLQNITWRQEYNKIEFSNVTDEDRGTYECIAENEAGEARQQIFIDVLTAPTITEFNNVTFEEGTSANVTCKASGRPQPDIVMMFEFDISENAPYYELKKDNDTETDLTLIFPKVDRSYEGVYYCNASNQVDFTVETIYMSVLFKPSFTKPLEKIWAWKGKTVSLSCVHESNPPAEVSWRYLGKGDETPIGWSLFDTMLTQQSRNNTLQLTIVDNYFGSYECVAKNHLGEAKKTFVIREAFRPSKVRNVTIRVPTATSAIFDIHPTETIGPAIIGYTAEYDEEVNYNITNIHLNRTWAIGVKEYKIDKLKPNTTYAIRFAGINEVGTGEFGNFTLFQTPQKSIPEPPSWDSNSEIVEIQSDNKMLKLKYPEHNGDPIDYYAVKYCRTDTEECTEHRVSPTNELKLDHLDHNTTYRVELVAHNSVGNSSAANIEITIPVSVAEMSLAQEAQSAGVIIGVSVVVVVLCIVMLDVVLFATRRQGMIANCYYKKNKKRKEDCRRSRDKKGLLKNNGESVAGDTMKRPEKGHKEYEYNKTTGVITGKHSAV